MVELLVDEYLLPDLLYDTPACLEVVSLTALSLGRIIVRGGGF